MDIVDGKSDMTESESSKNERLENELRIAKELIQSLKAERKKLRSDKNDLLQQVKQLCASLQEKEQELRNFIRKFDQRIRDSENSASKSSTDDTERTLALTAQLNIKDIQLQRMEQQLLHLSSVLQEQEGISPSGAMGLLNHGCDESSGFVSGNFLPDRGSYSADSGVRSSDRESAAGDMNLSDGACDNAIDSDSISLISSHHNMNQCEHFMHKTTPKKNFLLFLLLFICYFIICPMI